jgi:hypothetical protein
MTLPSDRMGKRAELPTASSTKRRDENIYTWQLSSHQLSVLCYIATLLSYYRCYTSDGGQVRTHRLPQSSDSFEQKQRRDEGNHDG